MPTFHRSTLLATGALCTFLCTADAEIELIDPAALGFGFPGFTLDVTAQERLDYDDRSGGVESVETRALVPFAKWTSKSLLLGASLNYAWHHADFGGGFGLGEKNLHAVDLQIFAAWRPENSKWWALGFVTPGLHTDFSSVDSDAFTLGALALLGYQIAPGLDIAAGVYAGYSLEDIKVIGAFGVIWRPSEHWIFQLTPPIVAIGWQPTRQWTVAGVLYPAGESWEVAETSAGVRQVEFEIWRAALSVERRFGEHWRVSARAGVAFGGELELRDADARVLSSSDLDPAPFAALAIRWAF